MYSTLNFNYSSQGEVSSHGLITNPKYQIDIIIDSQGFKNLIIHKSKKYMHNLQNFLITYVIFFYM